MTGTDNRDKPPTDAERFLERGFLPIHVDGPLEDNSARALANEIRRLRKGLQQIVDDDFPADALNAGTWAAEVLTDSYAVGWES